MPTDMVKALSTAQHVAIRRHAVADRLGHSNKRHHACHPVSGGSLLRGSGARCAGKTRLHTVVGTRVAASPSSRRCREGLRNILYYRNYVMSSNRAGAIRQPCTEASPMTAAPRHPRQAKEQ